MTNWSSCINSTYSSLRAKDVRRMAFSFPQRIVEPELSRLVIQISPYHVAKFNELPEEEGRLNHEYLVAQELYLGGISVPKPEGVYNTPFRISGDARCGASFPAFVMELVSGKTLEQIHKRERQRVLDAAQQQYEKARRLGFVPIDECGGNILWDPTRERVFLIDFEYWVDVS